jgi:hypothetical protein
VVALFDRIGDLKFFLIDQIVVKAVYASQVAVDGLRRQFFAEKIIDIGSNLFMTDMLDGLIDPEYKLLQVAQITSNRAG